MSEDTNTSTALVPSGDGPRFGVGDAVRVRAGVIDPDFPDIPLSGWAGVIAEIDDSVPPLYLVAWTDETLDRITPAYRVRCDHEGMDAGPMSLRGGTCARCEERNGQHQDGGPWSPHVTRPYDRML